MPPSDVRTSDDEHDRPRESPISHMMVAKYFVFRYFYEVLLPITLRTAATGMPRHISAVSVDELPVEPAPP
jgi:hypothetical protein